MTQDEVLNLAREADGQVTMWVNHSTIQKTTTFTFESHKDLSTPPQRTWVGLTDEEIAQGCKESWVTEQAFQSAVWWAEEKLKEKNT